MTVVRDGKPRDPSRGRIERMACFAVLIGLMVAGFWTPLSLLLRFSLQHEHFSHIILVPLVSAALFLLERNRIFSHVETRWGAGLGLFFAGALVYSFGHIYASSWSENDQLSIAIVSVVMIWVGGFVLCYGTRAARAGLFPVLFLFLMVPIPEFFLNRAILWLQTWSAEVSYAVFQLVGVPVLRTGFFFSLPGITIVVSEECSGIRSSLIMVITSLLAGHLFLRLAWTRALLTLATLPLLIVKNGTRIVTLSLLSVYVDRSFLTGKLHLQGGILFFLLALVILASVLWLLQKSERTVKSRTKAIGT